MDYKQKITEGILGVAIGDFIGVPYEFMQPHLFKEHPATKVIEYGSHDQPVGTWSDDTSMTLALIDALIEQPEYPDYQLIMDKFYEWLNDAKYTAGDRVFDAGRTCIKAIVNCARGMEPLESGPRGEYDCGNGGLMRILPVLFYVYKKYGPDFFSNEAAVELISEITSLTHAHPRCLIASGIYLSIAGKLLDGCCKEEATAQGFARAKEYYLKKDKYKDDIKYYLDIEAPNFKDTPCDEMSGSAYVVDTLKASIWAFLGTESYNDCIFKGINLGHDTDTVAAIAGGLAGLYYGLGGEEGIPLDYIALLKKQDYILDLCADFAKALE